MKQVENFWKEGYRQGGNSPGRRLQDFRHVSLFPSANKLIHKCQYFFFFNENASQSGVVAQVVKSQNSASVVRPGCCSAGMPGTAGPLQKEASAAPVVSSATVNWDRFLFLLPPTVSQLISRVRNNRALWVNKTLSVHLKEPWERRRPKQMFSVTQQQPFDWAAETLQHSRGKQGRRAKSEI